MEIPFRLITIACSDSTICDSGEYCSLNDANQGFCAPFSLGCEECNRGMDPEEEGACDENCQNPDQHSKNLFGGK